MKPFYQEDGITILQGDSREILPTLPDQSVNCCVTSPPYWGLRDYGVAGQLGLEPTPGEYVSRMVEVFREVRRVMWDDGTLWLNMGDSYARDEGKGEKFRNGKGHRWSGQNPNGMCGPGLGGLKPKDLTGIPWHVAFALQADGWYLRSDIIWHKPNPMPESVTDRPTKAHEYLFLLSKSERYYYDAEAIQEPASLDTHARYGRGRSDSHKWADGGPGCQTIATNKPGSRFGPGVNPKCTEPGNGIKQNKSFSAAVKDVLDYRNKRSVWTVPTEPYPEAHFATFPTALIEPCIKAGCPPAGKRCDCEDLILTPTGEGPIEDPSLEIGRAGMNRPRRDREGRRPITRREQRDYARQMRDSPHRSDMAAEASTAFEHYIRTDESGARPVPANLLASWLDRGWLTEPEPCRHSIEPAGIVLDPFAGSGTTMQVARALGCRGLMIELNRDYCRLAAKRLRQAVLPLAESPAESCPPVAQETKDLFEDNPVA